MLEFLKIFVEMIISVGNEVIATVTASPAQITGAGGENLVFTVLGMLIATVLGYTIFR